MATISRRGLLRAAAGAAGLAIAAPAEAEAVARSWWQGVGAGQWGNATIETNIGHLGWMHGGISEVVAHQALTPEERTRIEDYFTQKYRVNMPQPDPLDLERHTWGGQPIESFDLEPDQAWVRPDSEGIEAYGDAVPRYSDPFRISAEQAHRFEAELEQTARVLETSPNSMHATIQMQVLDSHETPEGILMIDDARIVSVCVVTPISLDAIAALTRR